MQIKRPRCPRSRKQTDRQPIDGPGLRILRWMKWRVRRPEQAVYGCGRRQRIFARIEKCVVLRCVVAEIRRLMIAPLTVAAEDERAARVFVAGCRRDGLAVCRVRVRVNNAVRSPLRDHHYKKGRSECPLQVFLLYQCRQYRSHNKQRV